MAKVSLTPAEAKVKMAKLYADFQKEMAVIMKQAGVLLSAKRAEADAKEFSRIKNSLDEL